MIILNLISFHFYFVPLLMVFCVVDGNLAHDLTLLTGLMIWVIYLITY